MAKEKRFCEQCGRELTNERHICSECKKINKREYAKRKYAHDKENGIVKLRYGITKCVLCGKEIIKNRPDQQLCYECYLKNKHKTVENYNDVKRSIYSNTIARQMILDLGFQLNSRIVIHHIDENPNNNILENFLILSVVNHAKLHRLLERKRLNLLKNKTDDINKKWSDIRDKITKEWLEASNIKILNKNELEKIITEPLDEDLIYKFE